MRNATHGNARPGRTRDRRYFSGGLVGRGARSEGCDEITYIDACCCWWSVRLIKSATRHFAPASKRQERGGYGLRDFSATARRISLISVRRHNSQIKMTLSTTVYSLLHILAVYRLLSSSGVHPRFPHAVELHSRVPPAFSAGFGLGGRGRGNGVSLDICLRKESPASFSVQLELTVRTAVASFPRCMHGSRAAGGGSHPLPWGRQTDRGDPRQSSVDLWA